jgi:hypothetical protein
MSKERLLNDSLALGAVACAGFLLSQFAGNASAQGKEPEVRSEPVHTIARTVARKEEFRQGGDLMIVGKYVAAVRQNGAYVEVRSAFEPGTGKEIRQQRIVYYADGRKVIFQDALRTKTTFFRSPGVQNAHFAERLRDPAADCLRTLDGLDTTRNPGHALIGNEPIGDLMTVHVRSVSGSTLDLWYAPKLGCEIVKQVVSLDGGRQSIQSLESYSLGEPDATLFAEPDGYQEVTPTEAAARLQEALTGKRLTGTDASLAALEKQYREGRPR